MKFVIFALIFAMFGVFAFADRPARCNLPEEAGRCLAYIPSFRFNADTQECVSFVYGGCGGNDNRFTSKEECEKICK